jgi:hypothetical protein
MFADRSLEIMRQGGIDQRGFDLLMEILLTNDGMFVVDNGAAMFIPLWNYILETTSITCSGLPTRSCTCTQSSRAAGGRLFIFVTRLRILKVGRNGSRGRNSIK